VVSVTDSYGRNLAFVTVKVKTTFATGSGGPMVCKASKKNSVACVHERTLPTERPPLIGEVSSNFTDGGCHVVSVTNPYGRNLGFL
jgi:hypothetical protein